MQCEALFTFASPVHWNELTAQRKNQEKKINKMKVTSRQIQLEHDSLDEETVATRKIKERTYKKRKSNTVQPNHHMRARSTFLFCPVFFTTYFCFLVYFTQDFVTFLLFCLFAPTIHMKHSTHDVCVVYSIALTTKCIIATLAWCSYTRCGSSSIQQHIRQTLK